VVYAFARGSQGELWPSLIYAFYWLGNQSSVVNTGTTAHEDKSVQRGHRKKKRETSRNYLWRFQGIENWYSAWHSVVWYSSVFTASNVGWLVKDEPGNDSYLIWDTTRNLILVAPGRTEVTNGYRQSEWWDRVRRYEHKTIWIQSRIPTQSTDEKQKLLSPCQ